MKTTITILTLLLSTIALAQEIEEDRIWRTKGIYDSIGNFVERAKMQSFLYSVNEQEFHRVHNQDKINMENGETKVFVYRDTLKLTPTGKKSYRLSEKETMTIHSEDSLTLHFNGYTLPYVKLDLKPNKVDLEEFKKELLNHAMIRSVDGEADYMMTYQENDLVKISPLKNSSEWESHYQIIDFNGFIVLQGIVSAPKIITKVKKGFIEFIEIDYRFENMTGKFVSKE